MSDFKLQVGLVCYGTAQGVKTANAIATDQMGKAGQHVEAMRTTWLYLMANVLDEEVVKEAIANLAQQGIEVDLTPYEGHMPKLGESSKP